MEGHNNLEITAKELKEKLNNGEKINSIKELLGHSSVHTTQIYTSNSITELKKIHAQAHPKGA